MKIFASHRAFATALWRQDRERPQSQQDNLANVVRGVLLLGPLQPSYLRHNLAHVYTEWVLDGRLGNPAGRLPSHPWLYDGLAEYEAYRVAPARLACRIDQHPALDVRRLSPSRWLALRSGPWGALEYCLAYRAVRAAIARDGLRCLVSFRGRRAWDSLAIQLESGKRPAICASRISPVR